MTSRRAQAFLVGLCCCVGFRPASGQVLQLPTFRQFRTTQTLVIPDRGTVTAAGLGRHATRASANGRQRVFGRSASGSSVQVHVTVHDLAEMDRQLLAAWNRTRSPVHKGKAGPASPAPRLAGPALSDVRRDVAAAEKVERSRAEADLAAAERWRKRGNKALAQNYYRLALRRDAPATLLARARAGLQALSP